MSPFFLRKPNGRAAAGLASALLTLTLMLGLGGITCAEAPAPVAALPITLSVDMPQGLYGLNEPLPLDIDLIATRPVTVLVDEGQPWSSRLRLDISRLGSGPLMLDPLVHQTLGRQSVAPAGRTVTLLPGHPFRIRVNLRQFHFHNAQEGWQPGTYSIRVSLAVSQPGQSKETRLKSRNLLKFVIDQ